MTTKDSQVVMPEFVSVTLYSKRDLEDMTKLRILTWGDYPGLSGWASKCDLGVHYEGGGGRFDYREGGREDTQARDGATGFGAGGRGHKKCSPAV